MDHAAEGLPQPDLQSTPPGRKGVKRKLRFFISAVGIAALLTVSVMFHHHASDNDLCLRAKLNSYEGYVLWAIVPDMERVEAYLKDYLVREFSRTELEDGYPTVRTATETWRPFYIDLIDQNLVSDLEQRRILLRESRTAYSIQLNSQGTWVVISYHRPASDQDSRPRLGLTLYLQPSWSSAQPNSGTDPFISIHIQRVDRSMDEQSMNKIRQLNHFVENALDNLEQCRP